MSLVALLADLVAMQAAIYSAQFERAYHAAVAREKNSRAEKTLDRDRRIAEKIAELRRTPEARAWGGLRREAEMIVDAEIAAEASA